MFHPSCPLEIARAHYVHYFTPGEISSIIASPLCVIGYGVDRPEGLAAGCPFVRVFMPTLTLAAYEVWTVSSPVTYTATNLFTIAKAGTTMLALAQSMETPHWPLEDVAEQLYGGILDLAKTSGLHLLRTWNYLPDITGPDKAGNADGMERYRRFNVGRHEAFVARLGVIKTPPAASALGSAGGPSVIYSLFGSRPGQAVENPRQVSAYKYPAQYGPRSPTFSRATLARVDGAPVLFISGTASIVGHESVHLGDVQAQTRETLANIHAVLTTAERKNFTPDLTRMKLKVYLRRPADLHHVREIIAMEFPQIANTIYLNAEICRSELLIEIEAVCSGIAALIGTARLSTG